MPLYNIYSEPLWVKYRSSVCTKSFLLYILITLLVFISPLLVIHKSQGLWWRHTTHTFQPDVRFAHQLLMVMETSNGPIGWSTSEVFNRHLGDNKRIPTVKNSEIDGNYDGVKDFLNLDIHLPLHMDELCYSISILLLFDYKLHTSVSKLELEGAALVQFQSPLPIKGLDFMGDLVLHHREPLPSTGHHAIYKTTVLPRGKGPKEWMLSSIMSRYWDRNITTRLSNEYFIPKPTSSSSMEINVKIRYVEQSFTYYSRFWYMIKWAWVQYVCVLIIFIYISMPIKHWLFTQQVVQTWVEPPKQHNHLKYS